MACTLPKVRWLHIFSWPGTAIAGNVMSISPFLLMPVTKRGYIMRPPLAMAL